MAKVRKSKQEEREELKKKRLATLAQKREETIIDESVVPEITEELYRENARLIEQKKSPNSATLAADEYVFKAEKKELQKELDSFENPTIYDMPDFLTDPNKEEKRREVMEKIKYLLKRRFSLITIADILETNDYARLDEIIRRKEETYKAVEKYTSEEAEKTVKLFSGFKKVVGDEYSRTYAEQEDRMKAAITILADGKYFKKGLNLDTLIQAIEDIISSVIDHPEFNLACQIESEFVMFEADRAVRILSDLRSRTELQELLEELRMISKISEERTHAYSVMDKLITGRERKIIPPEKGER